MLGVTAVALLLVSYLLYLRLGSEGASPRRLRWTIAELWVTFALIATAFVVARHLLGAGELLELLSHARALPLPEQVAIYGLLLIGVLLFVHLLLTLRPAKPREDHHD